MKIEPKKFNEFNHLIKINMENVTIDKDSWTHRKEIWSRNKETVVILCGDKHWKMSRTEWAMTFRMFEMDKKEYLLEPKDTGHFGTGIL